MCSQRSSTGRPARTLDKALRRARIARVEEHVRHENAHDLDAVMETFSANPHYDEEPWGEHHLGHGAVRRHYEQLFGAAPDLFIDILRRHATDEAARNAIVSQIPLIH